jgi:hypothetical protein
METISGSHPMTSIQKPKAERELSMEPDEREAIIQKIIDESNKEPKVGRKHKVLIAWRAKLGKEPTFLLPQKIDEIVRDVRERLGKASR